MRRTLLLTLSILMLVGGAYLFWLELRCTLGLDEGTCLISGRAIIGAAVLVAVAVSLLWEDFVAPSFQRLKRPRE
jgi:hypothetical protein